MSTCIPDPMLPKPYKITARQQDTHDTFTLSLTPQDKEGFSFAPGQFNMMYVFGTGEVPISISGDPDAADSMVHTIRAVGTVTNAINNLTEGQTVGIRGPFGSSWPLGKAVGKDVVIITGGIGLAPLRPVLYHILSHRDNYNRVVLLYGARRPADMLYQQQLHQWRGRFDLKVEITVDNADSKWYGHVGVVTALISKKDFDPDNMVAMICGPEIMMHFTIRELVRREVAWQDIYVSMERNMKCAIGFCGHCQYGAKFVCKDGPVFCYTCIREIFRKREI